MYEISSDLTITTYQNDVILVSLLLALSIYYNFSFCFYCWLWRPHCICLEQISIGKRPKYFKTSGFPCWILNNTHFILKPVTIIKKMSSSEEKCGRQQTKWYTLKVSFYYEELLIPGFKTIAYVVDKQSDICRR